MIARELRQSRIEDPRKAFSYTEFSYVLLQAYDFLHLFPNFSCRLPDGRKRPAGQHHFRCGSIRKKTGGEAFGATHPFFNTSSGTKFGKTEEGAVWLDPARTSPYKFYQFWMNVEDQSVEKLLKLFTFLPLERNFRNHGPSRKSPERREAPETPGLRSYHHCSWRRKRGNGEEGPVRSSSGIPSSPGKLSDEMLRTLSAEVPTGEASREFFFPWWIFWRPLAPVLRKRSAAA